MQTPESPKLKLFSHPAFPPLAVKRIVASVTARSVDWLQLRWRIEGADEVRIPPFAGKRRTDGLWRTTCFELFAMVSEGPDYAEFNFSPSEAFAAYDFDSYREGMRERALPRAPILSWRGGRSGLAIMDVAIPREAVPSGEIGLSAVIEEEGGTKSYWALTHPPGDPDFHHPTCFAATLAAPNRP
ncbi:DOMON-like domain-containing protein [Erythrobacter sp. HI0063]|uniref:DOMON-like domain-containing protein n=1 Tax=Erythrobacter sp. HI0063 TaxID=1822240 RepID=UPI00082D5019|nr:DOMON-like domain-containing protein [Erythrobacter sp. HI0063]